MNRIALVEVGVAWRDTHTWQIMQVWISISTPEDKIADVAIAAATRADGSGAIAHAWLIGYTHEDFAFAQEQPEPGDDDEQRLDRFYAEIERRQADGEPLTCMSCNAVIEPGEGADPCYCCGQPLCHFCSISGPRCRGC